jgi:hypothetical protein
MAIRCLLGAGRPTPAAKEDRMGGVPQDRRREIMGP